MKEKPDKQLEKSLQESIKRNEDKMENSFYRMSKMQSDLDKDSKSYPELEQFAVSKEQKKNDLIS